MLDWAKSTIEDAKKVYNYPSAHKCLDIVYETYKIMSEEGHSGMSWGLTKNVIKQLDKMLTEKDMIKGTINAQKIVVFVDDWITERVSKECNGDGFDEYIIGVYHSAQKAYNYVISNVKNGYEYQEVIHYLFPILNDNVLVPIEDVEEIWNDVNDFFLGRDEKKKRIYTTYQCKKMSSLFKDVYSDGHIVYRDIDRAYCKEKCVGNGGKEYYSTYTSHLDKIVDDLYPIKMPYMPEVGRYCVEVERFVYDKSNGAECVLIKSITLPDGTVNECHIPIKEIDITTPEDKYPMTIFARIRYDEYLSLKEKSKENN